MKVMMVSRQLASNMNTSTIAAWVSERSATCVTCHVSTSETAEHESNCQHILTPQL